MSISGWVILVLAVLCVVLGSFAYAKHEEMKATAAMVAPLKQAAKDAAAIAEAHRKARQACADAAIKSVKDNQQAIARAVAGAKADAAANEEFQKRLDNAPADCDEILKAKVCPALFPY